MSGITRRIYVILYWVLITLIVLYDRRFLIQKIGLGHFLECTVVRVSLLLGLTYINLSVLMPKLLERGKIVWYAITLSLFISVYIFLQQAYDVYLYGFVLGDGDFTIQAASGYLVFTTLWYLILTIIFYKALDWYEQKKQLDTLEMEIQQLKDKDVALTRDEKSSEMFIKSGTRKVKIDRESITYVQGLKDYAILFSGQEKVIVKGTLKNVEEMFPEGMLVRVHKSYMVSRRKVSSVSAGKVMIGNHVIPIGRSYRENVEEILKVG